MPKKYSLEIDQPNYTDEDRLWAVINYFTEEGLAIRAEGLRSVLIEGEKYRILSRSENATVLKSLFTPSLAFHYMIRLEKIK